jgi:hypothetical protein
VEGPGGDAVNSHSMGGEIRATRQLHAREESLHVPRRHVEEVDRVPYRLGMFLGNSRRRADKLMPERRAELDQFGMRW